MWVLEMYKAFFSKNVFERIWMGCGWWGDVFVDEGADWSESGFFVNHCVSDDVFVRVREDNGDPVDKLFGIIMTVNV